MRLNITAKELLELLEDEYKYRGKRCTHKGFDPSCSFCQTERVLQAKDEGELYVKSEITEG